VTLNDFLLNLAAGLVNDLLKLTANRLRRLAFGDAQQQALGRTYQQAFEVMLEQTAANLDNDNRALIGDLLHRFVADHHIANQLLDLALTGKDLPITKLRHHFEILGFDPITMPIDFDVAMMAFSQTLTDALLDEARTPSSPLYNRLSLGALSALRTGQQEQQALLQQVLADQIEAKGQLESYLKSVEGQLSEIRGLLTEVIRAGGERGVAITGDVRGSVIITGDQNIVLSDGGRLVRWWEEIGPDPQALLPQYLGRVAATHAHHSFPFHHLTQPILIDAIYLDLPIVVPRTDETLFHRPRPDRQMSGDIISRADELLKQDMRAALVGILGMGKTTTLRYLTWVYAQRPANRLYWRRRELVPFYARIRDLTEFWSVEKRTQGPDGFIKALAEAVSSLLVTFDRSNAARILRQMLDNGCGLILLDALDEFQADERTRNDFVSALDSVWTAPPFNDNFILMTSRPYRFLRPSGFRQYALQNLEQGWVETLVSRLGRALLQAHREPVPEQEVETWLRKLKGAILAPRLRDFWNPFYVTLMVDLGTSKRSADESIASLDSIRSLADLYFHFLAETIAWENSKGNNPAPGNEKALYDALGYIAYYVFVEPEKRLWLTEKVAGAMQASSAEVTPLLQFWLNTGLLAEDERRQTITFHHAGFREFGIAYAMADIRRHSMQARVQELRQRYEWDPEWETIWQLFMGLN